MPARKKPAPKPATLAQVRALQRAITDQACRVDTLAGHVLVLTRHTERLMREKDALVKRLVPEVTR
jgi:hypothetical protein